MQNGTNHTLQASNASHHTVTLASSGAVQRQPQAPPPGATVTRASNSANDQSDEDEDGGVHASEIARKKQEIEDKKKKKEESKKKKKIVALDLDDEDEDGAIISPKPKVKPIKTKKKPGFSLCFRHDEENEDEDGGVSKQKIAAAEKKKKAAEEKKKKKAQEKAIKMKIAEEDDDDDDDGGSKPTAPAKQAKDAPKKVPEVEVEDEDEDEDGGRIVKTYDTVKVIMSSKRPMLHNQSSKTKSSADNTDEKKVKPSKREKTKAPASYDTISKIVVRPSNPTEERKPKDSTSDFHFDPIPSDEETSDSSVTTDSSTSNRQSTSANKVNLLRSHSYRQAQHRSPPTVTRRSKVFSSIQRHSNGNDKDNDDLEITTDEDQPAVNNLVYAAVMPIAS